MFASSSFGPVDSSTCDGDDAGRAGGAEVGHRRGDDLGGAPPRDGLGREATSDGTRRGTDRRR